MTSTISDKKFFMVLTLWQNRRIVLSGDLVMTAMPQEQLRRNMTRVLSLNVL